MKISLGEGEKDISMSGDFLAVTCKNVFNNILRRTFLAELEAMVSRVHLKNKYYNSINMTFTISIDLHETGFIHKAILKRLNATSKAANKALAEVNVLDLEA